ncbi:hypothetical protein LJC56_08090 [Christensenellaceae bacterium OttesenSCG-928-K19]|nr:hypothetical protein [Christensenellaceae bacterium OttesenSCG-928-K19]
MNFCGLDVGTSGVKAVVFDETGKIIAQAEGPYVLELKSDGTRTLEAADLWEKTKTVLRAVAASTNGQIDAVAVSSFGEAFVCLDENDKEISEVMLFTDQRGEKEYFEAMKRSSDLEIAQVCGLPPSMTYSISKILYLKENRQEIYKKTKRMLLIEDFVNYRLTGLAVGDHSVACRTMLFDVHKREWSSTLFEKFDVDKSKFSQMVYTGTVIGTLRKEAAKQTGLPENLKVIAGGHDQPMAAVGAGAGIYGTVCGMGTSECMTPVFRGAIPAEVTLESCMSSEPMWADDIYCSLAYNVTSGLSIKWFYDVFASESAKPPYALFEENLPKKPTKIMVQPYAMGSGTPYNDHKARFAIIGTDAGTTRYDIYKAVMEGLALDGRLNRDALKTGSVEVDGLVCVGGGAQSRPWLQIKADVLQAEVKTLECKEAGALGCAIVCATALGCYDSIEQAGGAMSRIKDTFEPDKSNKAFYDEKYELYKQLHGDLAKYSGFAARLG